MLLGEPVEFHEFTFCLNLGIYRQRGHGACFWLALAPNGFSRYPPHTDNAGTVVRDLPNTSVFIRLVTSNHYRRRCCQLTLRTNSVARIQPYANTLVTKVAQLMHSSVVFQQRHSHVDARATAF